MKASIVDSETMEPLCRLKEMDEEKQEELFDKDISGTRYNTEPSE